VVIRYELSTPSDIESLVRYGRDPTIEYPLSFSRNPLHCDFMEWFEVKCHSDWFKVDEEDVRRRRTWIDRLPIP
jgi:hypothetical protein